MYGIIDRLYNDVDTHITFDMLTVGTVVDTNDPMQMGRIRVRCPAWNEDPDRPIDTIPWASYVATFGGIVNESTRGPNIDVNSNDGRVAYGTWFIPKVNARVVVACLDGSPNKRVWLGCIYDDHTPHTMPHGRFQDNDGVPVGPLSTSGDFIQPLNANQTEAFQDFSAPEYATRGADFSLSANNSARMLDIPEDERPAADDIEGELRQGYETTRTARNDSNDVTGDTLDSQVYSITTPGFHSFSMDDKEKNCRIRIRTTAGNQIILDDTNERMYISTPLGKSWIELDRNGNIDIYSERRISVHAEKDINITSDESIRMHGKTGVHIQSGGPFSVTSTGDANVVADNLRIKSSSTFVEAAKNLHVSAGSSANISSGKNLNLKGGNTFVTAGSGTLHLKGSGQVLVTGGSVHLNGPSAGSAAAASSSDATKAFLPNRVPEHESWARIMFIDTDLAEPKQTLELSVDSEDVGKVELGEPVERGRNWRR